MMVDRYFGICTARLACLVRAVGWLVRLVKTHGSLNEIFALEAAPEAWGSDAELRDFVRRVCDRSSPAGGSDGIYLYDAGGADAQAWFFNPDGSSAEFCGNGMRGLGRLILDLRGTDTEVVSSGGRDYTVHRAPSTPEGVRQVLLELPPLRFSDAPLPGPFERFTAVAVPNPHVIAVVEKYSEPDLIELGKRADEVFADGANVSFLQPLHDPKGHGRPRWPSLDRPSLRGVRAYLRAPAPALTPSCGSGVVASRAAYSRKADRPGPGTAAGRPQRRRSGRRLDPGQGRRLAPCARRQRHGGQPGRGRPGRQPGRPGRVRGGGKRRLCRPRRAQRRLPEVPGR